ncbi:MAG: hypothetical protein HC796_08675 [Synechococcaceae cyanobacterium RL_1_2]|nr:hypothetical protein [Synechococcaceae cyanobacterium RL_1_2]
MKIVTSWMEEGIQKGLEQAIQQAYEDQKALVESIAKKRFGVMAEEVMAIVMVYRWIS